jgi:hypothetical protein
VLALSGQQLFRAKERCRYGGSMPFRVELDFSTHAA